MRKIRIENGIKYGQCKICHEFFEMSDDFWYHRIDGYMGYESRCKKCSNEKRKPYGKNPEVSRRADRKYYETHKEKRLEYKRRINSERGYDKIHKSTCRRIRKLGIRPNKCQICGDKCRIVAHHPDYNDRFLIVFCCDSCHRNIHNGNIECPTPIRI